MKQLLSVFCVLATFCISATAWSRPGVEVLTPNTLDILPDRVFAPLGFDDNDNVQVVLDGHLADTCYKIGPTHIRVDHENHKIYLRQTAYYYSGAWCAEVRIPYVQTVNLGLLAAGEYEILLERPDRGVDSAANLPIAIATNSSADNFVYAPIAEARLERSHAIGGNENDAPFDLILSGSFANSCMHFMTAKMNIRANNVIEVLPVAKIDRTHSNCAQVETEFSTTLSLSGVAHGRYLIHIRSLNGQALNRIVDL